MFRIDTNHPNTTIPANRLAVAANLFYGRSNFHGCLDKKGSG